MTCYDHVKELAKKYAKTENVIVALFVDSQGVWQFIETTVPEFSAISPIEFISPLQ